MLKNRIHAIAHAIRPYVALGVISFLTIAVIIFWVRSYSSRDVMTIAVPGNRAIWMEFVRGHIQFVFESGVPHDLYKTHWGVVRPTNPLPSNLFMGFGAIQATVPLWVGLAYWTATLSVLVIPCWAASVISAFLLAYVSWRHSRRRRVQKMVGFPVSLANESTSAKKRE